jgi:hypothetical protein
MAIRIKMMRAKAAHTPMAARRGAGGRDAVKVCFIASPGGHLTQMRRLRDVYARHDSFIVTHRAAHRPDLSGFQRVYYVAEPGGGRRTQRDS